MKFKLPVRAIIAFFLFVAICVSVITAALLNKCLKDNLPISQKSIDKLSEIANLVEADYYYDASEEALAEALAKGYIEGLGDKYSDYYSVEEAETQANKLAGESYGIGILSLDVSSRGYLYIWRVYDDSPAQKAGIKAGDAITHVNGKAISDIGYAKAISMISGEIGKESELSIHRDKKTLKTKVKCADCNIQSVYVSLSSNKKYGKIEVVSFNQKTDEQFKSAVDYLNSQRLEGFVIDLRNNRGGVIDSAINMLDYLLPQGKTVRARYNNGEVVVRGESDENFVDIPIAILVNGNSASASEIFACSMRDYGSAVLIGETTYGKSVIQRSYDLKDGSRIKFTIGEYIPKSGESYNEVGLKPDIEVKAEYSDTDFYFLTEDNDNVLAAAYQYFNQLS